MRRRSFLGLLGALPFAHACGSEPCRTHLDGKPPPVVWGAELTRNQIGIYHNTRIIYDRANRLEGAELVDGAITVSNRGIYHVAAGAVVQSLQTWAIVSLHLNGSPDPIMAGQTLAAGAPVPHAGVSGVLELEPGDTLEARLLHGDGGGEILLPRDPFSEFTGHQVGQTGLGLDPEL